MTSSQYCKPCGATRPLRRLLTGEPTSQASPGVPTRIQADQAGVAQSRVRLPEGRGETGIGSDVHPAPSTLQQMMAPQLLAFIVWPRHPREQQDP